MKKLDFRSMWHFGSGNKHWPKCGKSPLSHWKMKCSFWIMFNFWWLAKQSKWWTSTKMQKKATQVIKKWNVHFWITFNFWWFTKWSEWWRWPKCEKGPLSHRKMKCLFLDYIQFLMIDQAIWVTNIDQNVKKGP